MLDKEYLKSLDDEICGDVYYYHNKINEKIDLYTVGCEISEWDGEKIARLLNPEELKNNIIICNTCAVTDFAQKGSEKLAHRLSILYPKKTLYFVGCGVNYNKEYYAQYGTILTNQEKFDYRKYGCKEKNTDSYFKLNIHRDAGYVKIQDGCYNNCAYCIIHKIRPHYIVPYEKIKEQVEVLVKQGKTNIQLIGTEITSYKYNGLTLTTLCERILKEIPGVKKITLGALDPASKEIDSLIDLIKRDGRIYNVLYLCTQSCSDTILKTMNRRHNADRLRKISRLAGKEVHLVFQLILGFPGETDELFQETVDLIKELKPVDYDAIVFSPRKGTPAYNMPNKIPKEVTDKRETIIYNLVKEYTFKNDQNTNRSFARWEKDGSDAFVKYKPKNLDKAVTFYYDLYDEKALKELFKILPKYKDKDKELVIITDFNLSKNLFDLDVNIKLLTTTFGTKVITRFKLNDDIIKYLSNNYWNINIIMYRIGTYIEIDFEKLNDTKIEDLVALFKSCQLYQIDDIETMTQKLIKARNIDYAKEIIKHFNINI